MKTNSELESMTDDELSQILAAMNGWEFYIRARTKNSKPLPWTMEHCRHPSYTCGRWRPMGRMVKYAQDLNACHEVVMSIPPGDQLSRYRLLLNGICKRAQSCDVDATARQRTVALILTLQK